MAQGLAKERIKALLEEAVTAEGMRLVEIHDELAEATYAAGDDGHDRAAAGIAYFINALFVQLHRADKTQLPAMLPVFELACGLREEDAIYGALEVSD